MTDVRRREINGACAPAGVSTKDMVFCPAGGGGGCRSTLTNLQSDMRNDYGAVVVDIYDCRAGLGREVVPTSQKSVSEACRPGSYFKLYLVICILAAGTAGNVCWEHLTRIA